MCPGLGCKTFAIFRDTTRAVVTLHSVRWYPCRGEGQPVLLVYLKGGPYCAPGHMLAVRLVNGFTMC